VSLQWRFSAEAKTGAEPARIVVVDGFFQSVARRQFTTSLVQDCACRDVRRNDKPRDRWSTLSLRNLIVARIAIGA
jgi:hypothetical protein